MVSKSFLMNAPVSARGHPGQRGPGSGQLAAQDLLVEARGHGDGLPARVDAGLHAGRGQVAVADAEEQRVVQQVQLPGQLELEIAAEQLVGHQAQLVDLPHLAAEQEVGAHVVSDPGADAVGQAVPALARHAGIDGDRAVAAEQPAQALVEAVALERVQPAADRAGRDPQRPFRHEQDHARDPQQMTGGAAIVVHEISRGVGSRRAGHVARCHLGRGRRLLLGRLGRLAPRQVLVALLLRGRRQAGQRDRQRRGAGHGRAHEHGGCTARMRGR